MPSLPPPSKVICVGRNFRRHAEELGNAVPTAPIFFLKPTSAIIGPKDPIRLPQQSREVQHEAELAAIIGERMTRTPVAQAKACVAAWTVLNDVTARDLQREDGGRFTRAKGFDTFCPISRDRVPRLDWQACRIQCRVGGELRQDGALVDMVFSPAQVLAHISACMTLLPGDVVSFGTPAGVAALVPGQWVEVRLVAASGQTLAAVNNPVVQGGISRPPRALR